jgi:predicted N-acyltransferase
MADRETEILARIASGVSNLRAAEWDALAGGDDPFLSHAFLSQLETSGSVGEGTGWTPLPVLVERDGRTIAAAPAYLKTHSQGEYIFDHGWADAWERAGGAYYPKLQVAVPFTPCPGRRLLGADRNALLAALETVTVQNGLSSAHINFLMDEEVRLAEARGWLQRHGIQFHWLNRGYSSFDDFLDRLSSRKRKAIRKERAAACAEVEVVTLRGGDIEPSHWDAMWRFYQHTGARKWGRPYLSRAFFDGVGAAMGDSALMFLALHHGRAIAGALNFIGLDQLYGRYWGAIEDVPFLHFELSYYRAIEWAIGQRLACVQAGAQGEHKLARGYEPVLTRSVHFIPDRSFRDAIARFLDGERSAIAAEMEWARDALPYRQNHSA